MKKLFYKPENWLLIAPILCSFFGFILLGNKQIDIHFHDTYYIIGNGIVWLCLLWLVCFGVSFAFNKMLRRLNKGTVLICNIHVVITLFCLVGFYILLLKPSWQMPSRYYEKTYVMLPSFAGQLLFLILIFQATFVLYAGFILIRRSIKHNRTSVRRNDVDRIV